MNKKWTTPRCTTVGACSLVLMVIPLLIVEVRSPCFFLRLIINRSGDDVRIKPQKLGLDDSSDKEQIIQNEEATSLLNTDPSTGKQSDMNSWDNIWDIAGLSPAAFTTENDEVLSKLKSRTSGKFTAAAAAAAFTSEYDGVLSKLKARELFETFPSPVSADTVQIYNQKAYHELIQTFITTTANTTICANGGSATAGGGHIKFEHRYYTKLVNYIRELRLNAAGGEVRVIERGHGARNSLHSAVFAPNFFPQNTDLFLWEFAINDYGYHIRNESIIEQERSMLIAWLREVEQMRPQNPPKVVLIYLWKKPFELNDRQQVINPVYDAHKQLAREFEFVVGHVNVASYFNELDVKEASLKEIFLADRLHPSAVGHLAITFLLLDLIRGKESRSITKSKHGRRDTDMNVSIDVPSKHQQRPQAYDWLCGTESEAKRFVQSQVIENDDGVTSSGWRSPLSTATLEKPRNDAVSGTRQMFFDLASYDQVNILGKQDPLRIDRQGSTSLKCCGDGASIIDYTTVRVPLNAEPIQNAYSLFFGFGPGLSDVDALRVYINSDEEHVKGKLVRVKDEEWECSWSWKDIYDPLWFAFDKEQPQISSIRICVENDRCEEREDGQSKAMLISMAVY